MKLLTRIGVRVVSVNWQNYFLNKRTKLKHLLYIQITSSEDSFDERYLVV